MLFLGSELYAQAEGSSFLATGRAAATATVTDYQAIGINPANLGRDWDCDWTLGLAEVGFSIYSDALVRSDLREILFSFSDITLTEAQEELFSKEFVQKGEAIDLDLMALGMGFDLGDKGGLAFDIRANASAYFKLNEFGSSLIFEGFDFDEYFDEIIILFGDTTGVSSTPENLSTLFDSTVLNFTSTLEFNLAYGKEVWRDADKRLNLGLGVRYIMGAGFFDFRVEEDELKGFSSLAPGLIFDLDSLQSPSRVEGESFRPVGHGAGFDIGMDYSTDKFRFGLALTDIGFIRWTGNVVSWNDYLLDSLAFSGINTTNILDELDQFIEDQIFETEGEEARTSILPTQLRAGVSYLINKDWELGADAVVPLNQAPGNMADPFVSAGLDWCFYSVFHASAGAAWGGNSDFRVPIGVSVKSPVWEAGVATRDILTLFGPQKPTISLAAGFLRFKFGA